MYEDPKHYRELLLSLRRLELQLRDAHKYYKEDEDHGRIGAIAAINAVAEFVRSIEQFHRDGLADPLIAISNALTDLDEGAKQHPMLTPKKASGGRPDITERQALRAEAAATMELAMQAGMGLEEAARMVAVHLQNRGVHIRGHDQNLTWDTVKQWRDRLRSGDQEDFAAQYYRDLIETPRPLGADPSTVKKLLLGALDGVLDKLKTESK